MTVENNEVPMIWTSKGNLPIEQLKYVTAWDEDENNVRFREAYFFNGEMVRESAHVYSKSGLPPLFGEQQPLV